MAGADRLTELAESMAARLVVPDGPTAVGLSGGADSAALLWLLAERGGDVVAIHVFHGLPASSMMSTAAGQVAARCGIRLEMAFVEPGAASEAELRRVRLAALVETAGDRPVLLAHTADDQAETVLMRILRGTGIDGLAGIPPRRDRIHHPLLGVTRRETLELAALAGLPYRHDPANEDRAVLRNRLRLEVLPLVEETVGGSPRESLRRLAATASEVSGFLATFADRVPRQGRNGWRRLPIGALKAVGDVVAAAAIRAACIELAGPYPPDREVVLRVLEVVHGRSSGTEIPGQLRAEVVGAHLVIRPTADLPQSPADGVALDHESPTTWSGWRFVVTPVTGPTVVPLSSRSIVFPAGAESLQVRPWTASDRVTGRRVNDALADAGVPADARPGWPLVTVGDEPVWLPLVRSRVWPAHAPGRYLGVVAAPEPPWQPSVP